MTQRRKKNIPRFVVLIAVLATGGATAWAMSATQMQGPETAWQMSQGPVNQVWGTQDQVQSNAAGLMPAQDPTQAMTPPPAAPARTVAGLPGVPLIIWGTPRPHADRGSCTNCHNVMQRNGAPVPSIRSDSQMPHMFRGVCGNCHQVVVGRGLREVAATVMAPGMGEAAIAQQPMMQAPMAQAPMMQAPMMQAPMMQAPMVRPPNDADWRGMEVRTGAQGVVVTKAEGTAQRAGLMPGDTIVSVNGIQATTVADFIGATNNGDLPQGTVIIERNGRRLAFELAGRGTGAAPPAADPIMQAPMMPNNPAIIPGGF